MTRDDLVAALAAAEGDSVRAARAALTDPATELHAGTGQDHLVSTAVLLTIFRGRSEPLRGIGLPALGYEDLLEALAVTRHEKLRLAILEHASYPGWVIFLSPDGTEVVGCVAVTGRPDAVDGLPGVR